MSLTLMKVGVAGLLGVGVLCPLCEGPSEAQPSAAVIPMAAFGAARVAGIGTARVVGIRTARVRTPGPGPAVASDTTRVKLAIEGMTCGSCATTARIVLRRVPGVLQAEVSYDEASAEVTYDASVTEPAEFIARLEKMTGYRARVTDGGRKMGEADKGSATSGRSAADGESES